MDALVIFVLAIIGLWAWAICKAGGDADDAMDQMYRDRHIIGGEED